MTGRDADMERRRFLGRAASAMAFVAMHGRSAWGGVNPDGSRRPTPDGPDREIGDRGPRETGDRPRILSLELLSAAPLPEMRTFYHDALGLPVGEDRPDRLTIVAGESRITFLPAGPGDGKPFYHFAFNIPENKLLQARSWQLERTPLIPMPPRLRDPAYPDDVANFTHWNAHSIYFLDPAGNVVEYIARHDLKNGAEGPFGSADILYASEIALVVDDVAAAASTLKGKFNLDQYRGADDRFLALGDEIGLLLVMKRGRTLNFNPQDSEKAARVFRTAARIRGVEPARYAFPGFPYEISAET